MAASLWSKSFGLGLYPAVTACRFSQRAFGLHAFRAGRITSSRFASSAAVLAHSTPPSSSLAIDETESSHSESAKRSPNADQPEFQTLKDAISPHTLKALTGNPFRLTNMSPVQAAVLPLLPGLAQPYKEGEAWEGPRDLMVKARTGTGKTLGFLVPAVEARLNALHAYGEQAANDAMTTNKATITRAVNKYARTHVGALIISPTRELATQIANEAIKLTQHHEGFEVRLFTGGLPKRKQLREWHTGRRDIVVTTPGRLRDFIENEPGFVDEIKSTGILILDEADTLLELGFMEDVFAIADLLQPTPQRQTLMFSATMPSKVQKTAARLLSKDHTFVDCVPKDASPTHLAIPQYYTGVPNAEEHLPHVLRLIAEDQLANPGKSKVLIFLPTTKLVKLFSTLITQVGPLVLPAGVRTRFAEMHAKKSMETRVRTSDWFRQDQSGATVMLTSDVSARGVDYPGITRVIQIGIPANGDIYVHRVGRTGRGSSMTGRADLVLLPWELGFLSWQLTDIPLKEITTNQLKAGIAELVQKHEQDPNASSTSATRTRGRGHGQVAFEGLPAGVSDRLAQIEQSIKDLQPDLSKEDVVEGMTSLLAFYASNSGSLRVRKEVASAGVQSWADAVLGEKVQLRVPSGYMDKVKDRADHRKPVDYKRQKRDYGDRSDRTGEYRDDSRFGGSRRSSYSWEDGDSKFGGSRRPSYSREDSDSKFGGFRRSSSSREDGGQTRWQGRGRVNRDRDY